LLSTDFFVSQAYSTKFYNKNYIEIKRK